VNEDGLKLTAYLGERDRAGERRLADALVDVFAAHELRMSVLLRGTSGFGAKHRLRTDRLLTLSEDLPVAAVAVDTRPRVLAALEDVQRLGGGGLLTLERARLLTAPLDEPDLPAPPDEAKLTLYVGRRQRAEGRPVAEAIVAELHRRGVAGATVLLGVDGTAHGSRRRARMTGGNAGVPLMIISVGEPGRLAAALPALARMLPEPLATWERVRVCKRDGRRLGDPRHVPESDPSGLPLRQKLMVYASEQSRHAGRPLHAELVRRLRAAGAAGATTLRGTWGYHGDHAPHGDVLWQLRRRVPVVTILVDAPSAVERLYPVVDEVTARTGLVTSEMVPTAVERLTGDGAG
jgi:PII-like signaling protein